MNSRTLSYDLIRVFATIGVVATHTENITSSPTNYLGGLSWWFANTIHSLVAVSVPLFVMLTGALLLRRTTVTYRYVVSKVVPQFLLPLVFWVLFYAFWNTYRYGAELGAVELIKNFFWTDIGHLYYLQIVIGLYLIIPPLSRWLSKLTNVSRLVVVFAATIISIVYSSVSFFWLGIYNQATMFPIFIPYVSYLLWGYYLAEVGVSKKGLVALCLVALGLVAALSVVSYWNVLQYNQGVLTFWTDSFGNYFWQPFTIPIIVLSLAIFLVLKNATFSLQPVVRPLLRYITVVSFGIYVIHPLVIELVDHHLNLAIHLVTYPLWIYYIQRTVIVFTVSAVVVGVLSLIPVARRVVGIKPKSE